MINFVKTNMYKQWLLVIFISLTSAFVKKLNCSIAMKNSSIKTIRIKTRQNKSKSKKRKLCTNKVHLLQHFPTYRNVISIQDVFKAHFHVTFCTQSFLKTFWQNRWHVCSLDVYWPIRALVVKNDADSVLRSLIKHAFQPIKILVLSQVYNNKEYCSHFSSSLRKSKNIRNSQNICPYYTKKHLIRYIYYIF